MFFTAPIRLRHQLYRSSVEKKSLKKGDTILDDFCDVSSVDKFFKHFYGFIHAVIPAQAGISLTIDNGFPPEFTQRHNTGHE